MLENAMGFLMTQSAIAALGIIFIGILIAAVLIVFGKQKWQFAVTVVFIPVLAILAGLYMVRAGFATARGDESNPEGFVNTFLDALFATDTERPGILDFIVIPFLLGQHNLRRQLAIIRQRTR